MAKVVFDIVHNVVVTLWSWNDGTVPFIHWLYIDNLRNKQNASETHGILIWMRVISYVYVFLHYFCYTVDNAR